MLYRLGVFMDSKILLLGHKGFPSGCKEAAIIILGERVAPLIDHVEISPDLSPDAFEGEIQEKIDVCKACVLRSAFSPELNSAETIFSIKLMCQNVASSALDAQASPRYCFLHTHI